MVTLDGNPHPRSPLRFVRHRTPSDDTGATVEEAIKYPRLDQRGSDEGFADVLRGDVTSGRRGPAARLWSGSGSAARWCTSGRPTPAADDDGEATVEEAFEYLHRV